MYDNFKSIKEVFNTDPDLRNIKLTVEENDVINDFEKIFPDLKKIVKPQKLEHGTITLRVENAAWRTELKFKETEIINKINSFYKENRIRKIKFSSK
jgi:hypothetical protein